MRENKKIIKLIKKQRDFKEGNTPGNTLLSLKKSGDGVLYTLIATSEPHTDKSIEERCTGLNGEEIMVDNHQACSYSFVEGVGYSKVTLIHTNELRLTVIFDISGNGSVFKSLKERQEYADKTVNQILSTFKFTK